MEDYPLAADVVDNIVIYNGEQVHAMIGDEQQEQALKAEFGRCLKDGPGVFVVKDAYTDLSVIDRCTVAFQEIVAEEKASGQGKGDHAAALPSLAKMSGSGTLCKRLVCMIKSFLLSITATRS